MLLHVAALWPAIDFHNPDTKKHRPKRFFHGWLLVGALLRRSLVVGFFDSA